MEGALFCLRALRPQARSRVYAVQRLTVLLGPANDLSLPASGEECTRRSGNLNAGRSGSLCSQEALQKMSRPCSAEAGSKGEASLTFTANPRTPPVAREPHVTGASAHGTGISRRHD